MNDYLAFLNSILCIDEELRKKYDLYGEEGLKDDHFGGGHYQSWNYFNEEFGKFACCCLTLQKTILPSWKKNNHIESKYLLLSEYKGCKPLYRPRWPMGQALNSSFHSMKWLGVLLLPPG